MSIQSLGIAYDDTKGMAIKEPRMLTIALEKMTTEKCALLLIIFLTKMLQENANVAKNAHILAGLG